jgi:hypothetical protein
MNERLAVRANDCVICVRPSADASTNGRTTGVAARTRPAAARPAISVPAVASETKCSRKVK